jgi:hypothetical protein
VATPATLLQVKNFFDINPTSQFTKEWKEVSPESAEQIRNGIGDGSLTY